MFSKTNRKLGIAEFWFFQDLVNVIYVLDIKGSEIDPKMLQKVLGILSEKHPTLRLNFNEKDKEFIEIKDYKISLNTKNISKEDLNPFLEKELNTDFEKKGKTPLWRVTLLKLNDLKEQKIIITASHAICDGTSGFILTNDILKYIDQLKNDNLEEIIPLKMLRATEDIVFNHDIKLDKERLNHLLETNVKDDELEFHTFIPIEIKEKDMEKRENAFLMDLSTTEQFQKVKSKLKEEKITFGSFLTASAFFVMKHLFNINEEFWVDIDVNYRDRFKEKLGYNNVGIFIGIFDIEKKVEKNTKFWDFCREIQNDIKSKLDDHSGAYWLEFSKVLEIDREIPVDKLYRKIHENYGRFADLNLSNIGNYPFQKKCGDLELNSLHCFNGEIPDSYSFLWYIASVDKFCFSMAYDKSLFSKSFAEKFFHLLNQFVLRSNEFSSDSNFDKILY